MPDTIEPEFPAALTDKPQAEAMAPPEGGDVVKMMTHEVDTDDMFKPSA